MRLIECNAIKNEIVVAMLKWDGNASASVRSRIAALAALGHLGGPEDLPLLNDCRNNPDVRLRTAARGAAERLRGKR